MTTDAEGLATAVYSDVLGRIVHRSTNGATAVRNQYGALGRLEKVYRAYPDQSDRTYDRLRVRRVWSQDQTDDTRGRSARIRLRPSEVDSSPSRGHTSALGDLHGASPTTRTEIS